MNKLRVLRKEEYGRNIVKHIKANIKRIIALILTLIFSAFAWFSYMRVLESDVNLHVSTWKIEFKSDEELVNSVEISVDHFYPGMEDIVKNINISNLGEKNAKITYDIKKLSILGNEYIIKDTKEEGDTINTVYKSETTIDGIKTVKLLNDSTKFPFEIILTFNEAINSQAETNNKGYFNTRLTWPYEIEGTEDEKKIKDNLDTQWGYNIAEYYKANVDNIYGLELMININANQAID